MKKTRNRKTVRRRGRALPSDACPTCGTMMLEKRATLHLPVNGEDIAMPSAAHLHCPKCGEITGQPAQRLVEAARGAR